MMVMTKVSRWRMALLVVAAGLGVVVVALLLLSARGIRLHSETVVNLTQDQAWAFFQDVGNLAKWDRSVAKVELTTTGPIGVGYTFDTIAPNGQRLSYRVSEFVPKERATIDLVGSDTFDRAKWFVALESVEEGTRVATDVEFSPKLQFFFLTPVLLLNQDGLKTDNVYLREQMEAYGRAHAP